MRLRLYETFSEPLQSNGDLAQLHFNTEFSHKESKNYEMSDLEQHSTDEGSRKVGEIPRYCDPMSYKYSVDIQ